MILFISFLILAFGRSITKSDNQNKSFLVMIKHQGTSGERKPLDILTVSVDAVIKISSFAPLFH